jgi:hypothetical protein
MSEELELISSAAAKEMFLEARKNEVPESPLSGYHYRLKYFTRWCQGVGEFDSLNGLSARILGFKSWRRVDKDLKSITLQGQLDALETESPSPTKRSRLRPLVLRNATGQSCRERAFTARVGPICHSSRTLR